MTLDNRRRALNEVVSLEAWHAPFSKHDKKVDLHVDVAFLTGRLGGEPESEVRFVLSLQQAEIVVIIPPGEPAKVDTASVSREAPQLDARLTKDQSTRKSGKAKAALKAGLDPKGGALGAKLDLEGQGATSEETRLRLTEAVKNMRIVHRRDAEDHHTWQVSAIGKDGVLAARPWDAAQTPRLKVVDTRGDRAKGLAPSVKVEVRCRREDLKIERIELKASKGLDAFKRMGKRNKVVAAEALIRSRLFEEGLLSGGDITDRYATLTLASVLAESD